jgi:hypothetical protein
MIFWRCPGLLNPLIGFDLELRYDALFNVLLGYPEIFINQKIMKIFRKK